MPQYYVVFNDDFTTVPYMESGTLPPNWEYLVENSYETATAEDIELADYWLSDVADVGADKDQLFDPFAIVTDPTKRQKTESPGGSKENPTIQGPPISDSEGDKTTSGTSSQSFPQTQQAAANKRVVGSPPSNALQAVALRDIFGSNPTSKPNTHDSEVISMQIPARLNPYDNGLRRHRLRDQREMEEF